MNDIDLRRRPWLDLWNPFTDDVVQAVGLPRVYFSLHMILFNTPGG
jgi:hypothetical protein